MVDCQYVCQNLSQLILNFSVDKEVIIIRDFNFPSINWDNSHSFQGDYEVLGSLLFLLFVNHLPTYIISQCKFLLMIWKYIWMNDIVILSTCHQIYLVFREIMHDTILHVTSSWGYQLNVEKCCVTRFARKKSSIERLDMAQFESSYVRGVGLSFVRIWVYKLIRN